VLFAAGPEGLTAELAGIPDSAAAPASTTEKGATDNVAAETMTAKVAALKTRNVRHEKNRSTEVDPETKASLDTGLSPLESP
jgi:hypothetical protein